MFCQIGSRVFVVVAAAAISAGVAFAQPYPTVVYTNIAGFGNDGVPGLEGFLFRAGATTQFGRPYRSPDGSRWIMTALCNSGATSTDELVLVGSGTTGTLVAQESVTELIDGRHCDTAGFDESAAITDSGVFAFGCSLDGTITTDDEVVLKGSLVGPLGVAIREGGSAPAIAGASVGATIDSITLENTNAAVSCRATITGVPTGQTTAMFLGGVESVAGQTGVTAPSPGADTWQAITANSFRTSADGLHWLARGDTNGPTATDLVVVVDGAIVLQEGTSPGGGLGGVTTYAESAMMSNGDWFVRGSSGTADWVVRNGALISQGGDAIPGGLVGETFSDATFAALYFHMVGNNLGHYIYGGVTSNSDALADAVLVWNNKRVIARQSDPVDMDGNGVADEGYSINIFNNDDGFLSDDGWFYFCADLRTTGTTSVGQAFLRMRVPTTGDMNCDTAVNFDDIDPFVAALLGPAAYDAAQPTCDIQLGDTNGDGMVNFDDIDSFVVCLVLGSCPN